MRRGPRPKAKSPQNFVLPWNFKKVVNNIKTSRSAFSKKKKKKNFEEIFLFSKCSDQGPGFSATPLLIGLVDLIHIKCKCPDWSSDKILPVLINLIISFLLSINLY